MREELAMEENREENPYQEEVNAFWVMAEDIHNALLKVGIDLFAPLPDEPVVVDRRMRKITPAVRRHWIALLRQLDESYPSEPDFHPHEVAAEWERELLQREVMELAKETFQKVQDWIEARMLAEQEVSRDANIEYVRKAKLDAKESGTPLDPKARELDHELRGGRGRRRR